MKETLVEFDCLFTLQILAILVVIARQRLDSHRIQETTHRDDYQQQQRQHEDKSSGHHFYQYKCNLLLI